VYGLRCGLLSADGSLSVYVPKRTVLAEVEIRRFAFLRVFGALRARCSWVSVRCCCAALVGLSRNAVISRFYMGWNEKRCKKINLKAKMTITVQNGVLPMLWTK
jgi:hypothetical protein